MSLPVLVGKRVTLRPLRAGDVADVYAIFSDRETMRYWSSLPLPDLAAAAELIREIERHAQTQELLRWGVADRSDDTVIGTCTLRGIEREHRRAELGYALRRDRWGRGYMREALTILLDHAFDSMDLHRIEADVDPRNAASIGLLERLRFRSEGLLRERWRIGGETQDSALYGLLAPDWAGRPSDHAAASRRG